MTRDPNSANVKIIGYSITLGVLCLIGYTAYLVSNTLHFKPDPLPEDTQRTVTCENEYSITIKNDYQYQDESGPRVSVNISVYDKNALLKSRNHWPVGKEFDGLAGWIYILPSANKPAQSDENGFKIGHQHIYIDSEDIANTDIKGIISCILKQDLGISWIHVGNFVKEQNLLSDQASNFYICPDNTKIVLSDSHVIINNNLKNYFPGYDTPDKEQGRLIFTSDNYNSNEIELYLYLGDTKIDKFSNKEDHVSAFKNMRKRIFNSCKNDYGESLEKGVRRINLKKIYI